MRKSTSKIFFGATLSAALAVGAMGTAHAGNSGYSYKSVDVSYADLNLANDAGAERLERRIKNAARTVCGPRPHRDINAISSYQQCFKGAMNGGKKAMVTLIAQAKTGQQLAQNGKITVGN